MKSMFTFHVGTKHFLLRGVALNRFTVLQIRFAPNAFIVNF